jgi:hypothetical protein
VTVPFCTFGTLDAAMYPAQFIDSDGIRFAAWICPIKNSNARAKAKGNLL